MDPIIRRARRVRLLVMAKASLQQILDALEQGEEWRAFVDRETGEVHEVQLETLGFVEDGGDPEDDEEAKIALEIVTHHDRFEQLPTKFEIHEWQIMSDFAESVEPAQLRSELLRAIHGKGAFRYFKDTLYRNHREKDWFTFRENALCEIAVDWCEENGIEYMDDRRARQ